MDDHLLPLRLYLLPHVGDLLLQLVNIMLFLGENLTDEVWLRADVTIAILGSVDGSDAVIRLVVFLVGREHRQKHAGLVMLRSVVINVAVQLLNHVLQFPLIVSQPSRFL